MQKSQIPKFVFDPLWAHLFGGTMAPQGDLRSKKQKEQTILRISFYGRSGSCPKSEIKKFLRISEGPLSPTGSFRSKGFIS